MTLHDVERREVGDVDGKTLLHLQCHFGLDTMSWARLGATATGVDFSDTAIDLARSLNDELGLNARFIRSDVYDLPDVLDEEFDVVFTSYGVMVWLPRSGPVGVGHPPHAQDGRNVLHRGLPSVSSHTFEVSESGDLPAEVRLFRRGSDDPGQPTELRRQGAPVESAP